MLNHQPFNRGIKENHDNVLPQCSCSAADSGRGKTCRATEEGEAAWSPLTHLVKNPVTWSSYCSHNTILYSWSQHPEIRVQTDCSNVLQPNHPPCATPTKTKGRRARGLLAGSVVGFPAQTCSQLLQCFGGESCTRCSWQVLCNPQCARWDNVVILVKRPFFK